MNYYDSKPIEVGKVEQLLIDDHIVEDAWQVKRKIYKPTRHPASPILTPSFQWEDGLIQGPSVFFDEKKQVYQMIYSSYCRLRSGDYANAHIREKWNRKVHGSNYNVCYAESKDAVNWEKPLLDICSWKKFKKTNIVFSGQNKAVLGSVLRNPDVKDKKRKFLMVYGDKETTEKGAKRFLASSPDGLHWKKEAERTASESLSDGGDKLVWDPQSEQWFRYIRSRILAVDKKAAPELNSTNIKRRKSVMISKDLETWSFPRTVLFPDELDPMPNTMDSWSVFKYGSHFIGIFALMDESNEGKTQSQLVSSVDGVNWQRMPERQTFFDLGPEGAFDAGRCALASPVEINGRWYFYYCATPVGQNRFVYEVPVSAFGLAVSPIGRLVGRNAGEEDGFLLTKEIKVGGKYLEINCEPGYTLWPKNTESIIKVGLTKRSVKRNNFREEGYVKGFSLNDCENIDMANTAARVCWNGNSDLSSLKGKSIYLRFYLKNASLYSFKFVDK